MNLSVFKNGLRLLAVWVVVVGLPPGLAAAAPEPDNPPAMASVSNKQPVVENDAEILTLLMVLDRNEVMAGQEVQDKKVDPALRHYAQTLHNTHARRVLEGMRLGRLLQLNPFYTDAADVLRLKSTQALSSLAPLKGSAFTRAYLQTRMQDHADALDLINQALIPNASHPALKAYLLETRQLVERHLEQAERLNRAANGVVSSFKQPLNSDDSVD